jgi:nucleotide-binding universal stress UspA family protein
MQILVGVDGSQAAAVACEFVASRTWPTGTRIELLGAMPHGPMPADRIAAREALERSLEAGVRLFDSSRVAISAEIIDGDAADALIGRAEEAFADLIVVGNRGLGPMTSAILGSVSAHLIDHAPCPVMVARSPHATRMVLATDGTHSSRNIPSILAAWHPALSGMPVEVVSVASREAFVTPWAPEEDASLPGTGPEMTHHRRVAEAVADELMELGWHSAAIVAEGDPAHEIVAASRDWHADLIVTGSRGIGTIRRLLRGSVAHDVMLHAASSVLVMRGRVPARTSPEAMAISPAFG